VIASCEERNIDPICLVLNLAKLAAEVSTYAADTEYSYIPDHFRSQELRELMVRGLPVGGVLVSMTIFGGI